VDGYVPVETYNKCFLNEIVEGYDRCLYLDSDILIQDDVNKLLHINLNGCAIGASLNIANIHAARTRKTIKSNNFRDYLENKLYVKDVNKYFQAGVVLLDLNETRKINLLKSTIDVIAAIKKPIFYDQCVFNKIFYGNVKFFSTRWNHVWYMQDYAYLKDSVDDDAYFDYANARVNPGIIHFASGDKYYNKPEWKMANKFWDFAKESAFKDDINLDCEKRLSPEQLNHLKEIITKDNKFKPRLLVHLHLFYPDQLDYMLSKIASVHDVEIDFVVTQIERNKLCEAKLKSMYPGVRIFTIPNAGYDIFPFLIVLKNVKITDYDYVLKIHTKNAREPGKDTVYGVPVPGFQWRDRLIDSLIGSPEIFKKNLLALESNKNIGALGASEFIFSSFDNNEEINYNLPYWRSRFKLKNISNYVGGSMFFARAYPFDHFRGHGLTEADFGVGTAMSTKDCRNLAHVFERLLGFVTQGENMKIIGV